MNDAATAYDCHARRDTPLALTLKARIAREGPISVALYMDACLNDPDYGYYRTQSAIGAGGDFVTAPEISQIFGELIGLWAVVTWQHMGMPERINLVELGPGRGTLMRDALRAARVVPEFASAAQVVLVEQNAALERAQRETLAGAPCPMTWARSLRKAPGDPAATIVIANEFLDTLPVRQLVREGDQWCERGVVLDADDVLQFAPTAQTVESSTFAGVDADVVARARDGDIIEVRPSLDVITQFLSEVSQSEHPLAALLVDYGHVTTAIGETLQAVRAHEFEHPLTSPGEADLSTQVDFADVARACSHCGFMIDGPVPQAAFLANLGVYERASKLMAKNDRKAGEIEAGVARLVAPQGMGGRFKVMGVRSRGLAPLAGFEAQSEAR